MPSFLVYRLLLASEVLLTWVRKDKHTCIQQQSVYIHRRNGDIKRHQLAIDTDIVYTPSIVL